MTSQVKIRKIPEANISKNSLEGLTDYVHDLAINSKCPDYPLVAFKHGNHWYFRASWLIKGIFETVTQKGVIEEIGTYRGPDEKGIIHCYISDGNAPTKGPAKFYRVKDPKINGLISKRAA